MREAFPTVAGKRHEGAPKSDAGKQIIQLNALPFAPLRGHRTLWVERRLMLAEAWHDRDLVCASEVGTPCN